MTKSGVVDAFCCCTIPFYIQWLSSSPLSIVDKIEDLVKTAVTTLSLITVVNATENLLDYPLVMLRISSVGSLSFWEGCRE